MLQSQQPAGAVAWRGMADEETTRHRFVYFLMVHWITGQHFSPADIAMETVSRRGGIQGLCCCPSRLQRWHYGDEMSIRLSKYFDLISVSKKQVVRGSNHTWLSQSVGCLADCIAMRDGHQTIQLHSFNGNRHSQFDLLCTISSASTWAARYEANWLARSYQTLFLSNGLFDWTAHASAHWFVNLLAVGWPVFGRVTIALRSELSDKSAPYGVAAFRWLWRSISEPTQHGLASIANCVDWPSEVSKRLWDTLQNRWFTTWH